MQVIKNIVTDKNFWVGCGVVHFKCSRKFPKNLLN